MNAQLIAAERTNWLSGSNRGYKFFEYSNHLGNVLTVTSDKKLYDSTSQSYSAQVISASDYYPFGWAMYGRENQPENYRFGFNSKENDTEYGSSQLVQDYGFRIYNPSIGKFLSEDPLTKDYPELTPYQFASNRPIEGTDLDGLEFRKATDEANNVRYTINFDLMYSPRSGLDDVETEFYGRRIESALEKNIKGTPKKGPHHSTSASFVLKDYYMNSKYQDEAYTILLVDQSEIKELKGSKYIMGATYKVGDTETNLILVSVTDPYGKKRSIEAIMRTTIHEVAHSGGVRHFNELKSVHYEDFIVFVKPYAMEMQGIKINEQDISKQNRALEIMAPNIMMSGTFYRALEDVGVDLSTSHLEYLLKKIESNDLKQITPEQFEVMDNTVKEENKKGSDEP